MAVLSTTYLVLVYTQNHNIIGATGFRLLRLEEDRGERFRPCPLLARESPMQNSLLSDYLSRWPAAGPTGLLLALVGLLIGCTPVLVQPPANVTLTPPADPTPAMTPTSSPNLVFTPAPGETSQPPSELSGRSLAEIEAELLAPGYLSYTQVFTRGQAVYYTVIYQPADFMESSYNANHLLIYKIQDGQFMPLYYLERTYRMDFLNDYAAAGRSSDWFDMNGDGLLELPYSIFNGGNCWGCTQRQVLQLRADDTIISLTPVAGGEDEFSQPFVLRDFIDADGDGLVEWVMFEARWESAFSLCKPCSPVGFRLYAWDGQVYRNASARFPDYYQQRIDALMVELDQMAQSDSPWLGAEPGRIISLLLAYDNAGRREEGWPIFERLADPEQYTGRASQDFLDSLQVAYDYFKERYQAGLPF